MDEVEQQEKKLMEALTELLAEYGNYDPPRIRYDGDIQIPLDVDLKRQRTRRSNLASAFSRLMADDLGPPKRRSSWIK
ncbi:hypothetical protein N9E91_07300 [Alphaproteobacteria bacterium]|jgi:hypothetical protein|nr:hypothetical protein [Alphaproteobacteria bacterium]